jgi:transcriptional regulator with XRE-family HTH domain
MDTSLDQQFDLLLAQRLVSLRAAAGWSLDELAERSGISRATLSRLERGETSPSTQLLHRLARAHGITLSRLLADVDARPLRHLRAAEQPRWADRKAGFERRMRCPPLAGFATEVIEVTLAPRAHLVYEQPSVAGLEHHLCLLEGRLRLNLAGDVVEAEAGDSISFHALGRAEFENPGETPLRYLLALTPPPR